MSNLNHETESEMLSRLELMAENEFDNWDLSTNDKRALKWAVKKIKELIALCYNDIAEANMNESIEIQNKEAANETD